MDKETYKTVSYTHLDVYKRQAEWHANLEEWSIDGAEAIKSCVGIFALFCQFCARFSKSSRIRTLAASLYTILTYWKLSAASNFSLPAFLTGDDWETLKVHISLWHLHYDLLELVALSKWMLFKRKKFENLVKRLTSPSSDLYFSQVPRIRITGSVIFHFHNPKPFTTSFESTS